MTGPHKKIRFSSKEIKKLGTYPSATDSSGIQVKTRRHKPKRRKLRRFLSILFCSLLALFVLAVLLLKVGISGEILTGQMQAALDRQLKNTVSIKISNAQISLDDNFHIALEASDVKINDLKAPVEVEKIGAIKLGLSTLALLTGRVEVHQVELHQSRLSYRSNGDSNVFANLPKTVTGQVDMAVIGNLAFQSLDRFFLSLQNQSIRSIVFDDVDMRLKSTDRETDIRIDRLSSYRSSKEIKVEGDVLWNDSPLTINMQVQYQDNKAVSLMASINNFPLHLGAADGVSPFLPNGRTNNGHFKLKGQTNFNLSARRDTSGDLQRMDIGIDLGRGLMDLGTEQNMPAHIRLKAEFVVGSGKIEILPSLIEVAGVRIPFNGAMGAMPSEGEDSSEYGEYRFEIVGNDGRSAPSESSEKATHFALKVAGHLNPENKRIEFNEITLNTTSGQLLGRGTLVFGQGSPETIFVLNVPKLSSADVKQLWPVNVAPGGRRWVLSHVYGGEISNGTIEIALPLGYFRSGIPAEPLSEKEIKISAALNDIRSDIIGELPAIRDAAGKVEIQGTTTTITLDKGIVYMPDNRQFELSNGMLVIPWGPQRPVYSVAEVYVKGDLQSAGQLIGMQPINARSRLPFNVDDVSGQTDARVKVRFPVTHDNPRGAFTYDVAMNFKNFSLAKPMNDISVAAANGTVNVTNDGVHIIASGRMNDLPADVDIVQPFNNSSEMKKSEKLVLKLDDDTRKKHFSFLDNIVTGTLPVEVGSDDKGKRHIKADLTQITLNFPWIGWSKGKGIAAIAEFDLPANVAKAEHFEVEKFKINGSGIDINGSLKIIARQLDSAIFSKIALNKGDDISLDIKRQNKTLNVTAKGNAFDVRSLIKSIGKTPSNDGNDVILKADINTVTGFNNEKLNKLAMNYSNIASKNTQMKVNALTASGQPVTVQMSNSPSSQTLKAESRDAGAVMRFMDYYDKIYGGTLKATLSGNNGDLLTGPVSIRNFNVINETKLEKLVSTRPVQTGKSLNEAVNGKIDSSKVYFDVAYAKIGKGNNYLVLDRGVVRGPSVGATFQGVLYDASSNMSITGTFMPAYGLNRLFGELPILGQVLGNGRDRGLIGITFKIEGNTKQPQIMVNPISAIAPGIFRSIFEFQ